MSLAARDASHSNIFKAMKDITFEETISHQCGVTMNDFVEARAIAEFMGREAEHHRHLQAGDDPHRRRRQADLQDGRDQRVSRPRDDRRIFEINTSTHYGRMVSVDDNTVILFGNMDEMFEYIG